MYEIIDQYKFFLHAALTCYSRWLFINFIHYAVVCLCLSRDFFLIFNKHKSHKARFMYVKKLIIILTKLINTTVRTCQSSINECRLILYLLFFFMFLIKKRRSSRKIGHLYIRVYDFFWEPAQQVWLSKIINAVFVHLSRAAHWGE